MKRFKPANPVPHKPSTHDIFVSLRSMTAFSQILFDNIQDKPYKFFLQWLLNNKYFEEDDRRFSIKAMAEAFRDKTTKVTLWLHNIYEDILTLNAEQPELFYTDGIKLYLSFTYFGNHCSFQLSMPVMLREFELIQFYFLHAKLGTSRYWVKSINHEIEYNSITIYVFLEGGFPNRYREFTVDKALFQGKIGLMPVLQGSSFDIDKRLNDLYRN